MSDLKDLDLRILRACNGDDVPDFYRGAAVNATLGFMKADGLIEVAGDRYVPTAKGRAVLEDNYD
jgi:hypothetical protein